VILRNAARGQALIETIVAVLLLVPLLIATIDLWRRQAAMRPALEIAAVRRRTVSALSACQSSTRIESST